MSIFLEYTFEAENDEEAREIVENADGSEYKRLDGGEWSRGTLYRLDEDGNEIESV